MPWGWTESLISPLMGSVGRWEDGAAWGMSHLENISFLRCCWICFYSWKVKGWKKNFKKSYKVTGPWGKCGCFPAVTQQTGPGICRMSYKIWGNPWARAKGQEKVWKWHIRQVFGRVQALKMDGGKAGVAFLGSHLESKAPSSVPLPLPGPAGSHPMGSSGCFKIPTGALIPHQAAPAMMGFVPSCSTGEKFHLYDALKHRESL